MAIRALIFDVFGTLVDWRTSIAAQAQSSLEPLGYSTDWLAFADAWRNEYQPAMEKVRSGQRGFCKLDVLHIGNISQPYLGSSLRILITDNFYKISH